MSNPDFEADDRRNVGFYTDLVAQHGVHPHSLNWGSAESQRLRFEVLGEAGLRAGQSVLDVGCGLGDFYGWIRERGLEVDYRGVDLTPRMIEVARSRFPEGHFDVLNVLEAEVAPADFVVASGIFYLRQHEPIVFMQQVLTRLFALCRRTVAFNTLSAWSPDADANEFYADPLRTLEFCRSLTPWVALRHDYHPRDFTIYLHRESTRP